MDKKEITNEIETSQPIGMDVDNTNDDCSKDKVKEMDEEESIEMAVAHPERSARILNLKRALVAITTIMCIALCCMEIDGSKQISQTLAIAIFMAVLWLTEYIPLVVTAFLPLFLFPAFGILDSAVVSKNYANDTIFLFVAGFMVAFTLERWDLHRRFALKIISLCGAQPAALLFGMMLATFILSMFVSNAATTVMMVPNAVSVIESLERSARPEHRSETKRFGYAAMLGICYSANVGGMASVIGTPPNLVFLSQLKVLFPDSPEITFASWFGFGFPLGFSLLLIIWLYLKLLYLRGFKGDPAPRDFFRNEYIALGPWYYEQVAVLIIFVCLAILWIFRPDIEFDKFTIPGWSGIFPVPDFWADATIGMGAVVLLFVLPARPSKLPGAPPLREGLQEEYSTTLLDWPCADQLPHDVIYLFGGGFALANAFVASGLSAYLGEQLAAMNISLVGQVFMITFTIVWLTEITSNTATSNIMIPLAGALAIGSGVSPYTFMIPATLACSCAFVLPIATPPNMIAYASGRLPMIEMNKAGVFLNFISTFLILGLTFTLVPVVLKVDADELPDWAQDI